MNVAGTSLAPGPARERLVGLTASGGATWEVSEVTATRYGAYHNGRLGPAISFSVVHECTDLCGCSGMADDGSGGCGNR